MNARGIFRLRDMIGSKDTQSSAFINGPWYRAVPLPFYFGLPTRFRAAWAVITGDAVAVRWPEAGELEKALDK